MALCFSLCGSKSTFGCGESSVDVHHDWTLTSSEKFRLCLELIPWTFFPQLFLLWSVQKRNYVKSTHLLQCVLLSKASFLCLDCQTPNIKDTNPKVIPFWWRASLTSQSHRGIDFCSVSRFYQNSYLYFLFSPNSQWSQSGFNEQILFLGVRKYH